MLWSVQILVVHVDLFDLCTGMAVCIFVADKPERAVLDFELLTVRGRAEYELLGIHLVLSLLQLL